MQYHPIGTIHTPHTTAQGMPIQPSGAHDIVGTVEIAPEFAEALTDLAGFSRLILLYAFHRSEGFSLKVTPFLDNQERGLFATRAPRRPNPIGLSIVRLDQVAGNTLHIRDVDILDGTPLLDIKPYVPTFDSYPEARTGWLEDRQHASHKQRSDERFT